MNRKVHLKFMWVMASALLLLVGCGKDEPTPIPSPNPNDDPTEEELYEQFWQEETPHWFYDQIDTLIIDQLDAEGYLTHNVDNQLSRIWEWKNTPSPAIYVYMYGKKKVDPVTNPARYIDICQQMQCRPKSNRVNFPEIVNLPEFEIKESAAKFLIFDTLVNVDVIALNQFNDTIFAGDLLRNNVVVNAPIYQGVIEYVVKNQTDKGAPYSTRTRSFNSSNFQVTTHGIIDPNNRNSGILGPFIGLHFNKWSMAPGTYSFKVRVRLKHQNPLETEFKILFEDNIPNP